MMARANYQERRNEIARALGFRSYYEQRTRAKVAPREVARKRAALNKRMGGSYRGRPASQLKPPRGGTVTTKTARQTTTDTRSKAAFTSALKAAARNKQRVALRVNFGKIRQYKKHGTAVPGDALLYARGIEAKNLLNMIEHPKAGDTWHAGDPWAALEVLAARDNTNVYSAKDVTRVHLEAFTKAPELTEGEQRDLERQLGDLTAEAYAIDARTGAKSGDWNSQGDWIDSYLDRTPTPDTIGTIRRHLRRYE
jgi:hypothetical protein